MQHSGWSVLIRFLGCEKIKLRHYLHPQLDIISPWSASSSRVSARSWRSSTATHRAV